MPFAERPPSLPIEAALEKALGLHKSGGLKEAETLYRQILKQAPDILTARLLLAILLIQKQDYPEALGLLDTVLAAQPDLAIALLNRGNALTALGRLDDALRDYGRGLAQAPRDAELHTARGIALLKPRRFAEALADFDAALETSPDFSEALFNRGHALQGLRRFAEAVISYSRVIALNPDRAAGYNHRANALRMDGRPAEALADTERALALEPDNAESLNDRGNALQDLNRFDEAIASYDRALRLRPDFLDALHNRGLAQRDSGDFAAALAGIDRMLAIAPDDPLALWSRGIIKMLTGALPQGLALYEWRKKMPTPVEARHYAQPLWTGREDIAGKTLFLYVEQGLGDTIQFYRYALLAAARGAHVILSVQNPLVALLQGAGAAIEIVGLSDVPPDFDFHAPLMSLPLIFGTTMDAIPAAAAYLHPDKGKVEKWRQKIGAHGFKIGICWQGGPAITGRSFPLALLAPIAALPDVRLISLQKGHGVEQLAALPDGMTVETLGDDFDSGADAFLDTVAVLPSLDLVITADTALAHLAGTLGRPTWLALKYVPDWRWFLERSDSPWYSSLELFRQPAPGDWLPVFAAMTSALQHRDWTVAF